MSGRERSGPLEGIRVLDLATIIAGPMTAMLLGDFGAEVIKIEHPRGDPIRTTGPQKDGHGLSWKVLGRNKRTATLNLSTQAGADLLVELVKTADVVIENFRPGVMERWNLGYERLSAAQPGLVMLRVTGFGQFGPYSSRAGFGTLAEAMSGFAHSTGEPSGPPTLPPFGLADSVAALAAAYGVMTALYNRDHRGGRGQVIDLAIIEPILTVIGPQATVYDQLGVIPQRLGNRAQGNAPRNTYRTADGHWIALATVGTPSAEQTMRAVGHPEVVTEPWFTTGAGRGTHGDELDRMVADWVAAHTQAQAIEQLSKAGAAVAPVYDISQVMADPQYQALKSIATVPDEDLGPVRMQNVVFRMSATPGSIQFAGRRIGQDNESVFGEIGIPPEKLAQLKAEGIV